MLAAVIVMVAVVAILIAPTVDIDPTSFRSQRQATLLLLAIAGMAVLAASRVAAVFSFRRPSLVAVLVAPRVASSGGPRFRSRLSTFLC